MSSLLQKTNDGKARATWVKVSYTARLRNWLNKTEQNVYISGASGLWPTMNYWCGSDGKRLICARTLSQMEVMRDV